MVIQGNTLEQLNQNRAILKQPYIDLLKNSSTENNIIRDHQKIDRSTRRSSPFYDSDFLNEDGTVNRCKACYGNYKINCDRLIQIKNQYDPKDLFGYDYGIPLNC